MPPVDVRAVDLSSLAPGMRQGELVLEGGRGEVRRRRRPERRRKTLPQRRLSLVLATAQKCAYSMKFRV